MRISLSTPEFLVLGLAVAVVLGGTASAAGWARATMHWKVAVAAVAVAAAGATAVGIACAAGALPISIFEAAGLGFAIAGVWLVAGMAGVGGVFRLGLPLPARAALSLAVLLTFTASGLLLSLALVGLLDLRPLPSASACDALWNRLASLNPTPGTVIETALPRGSRWMTVNGRIYVLRTGDGRAYLWGRTMWRWHDDYDGFLCGREPLDEGEVRSSASEDRDEGRWMGHGWIEFAGVTDKAGNAPDPANVVGAIVRPRGPCYWQIRNYNELN